MLPCREEGEGCHCRAATVTFVGTCQDVSRIDGLQARCASLSLSLAPSSPSAVLLSFVLS